MADSRGEQDLFGLDIDRLAKGFGEQTYDFLAECQVRKMKGDSVRWFQKTAGTLSLTDPSASSDVSPGSRPNTLEVSWTRNTSYKIKFFIEGFLDEEDIKDSELDTLGTTIRDLTEVIKRDRDAHLWDIMSESQTPVEIQTFATTAVGGDQWDAANFAADIIKDLERAKKLIKDQGYEPIGASLLLDTAGNESLVNWLISGKGSSIPGFSSEKIKTGVIMEILNLNVKVSLNVTTDNALVIVPKRAVTYSESTAISAEVFRTSKRGRNIEVDASGIAYRTDPNAIVLITDINTA